MPNKIFLIGFMASGKSTLGKKLAKHLAYGFIDTDKLIEAKNNQTIEEIFVNLGEENFRNQEQEILKNIALQDENLIISTGGGMACNQVNMDLMQNNGKVIFLSLDLKSTLKRLRASKHKRPLLKVLNEEELENKISALYTQRLPFYEQAHLTVNALNLKSIDMIELSNKIENIKS